MNVPLLPVKFRYWSSIFLSFLFLSLPAQGDSIFFGLSLNGNTLTLTNQGGRTAYYPVVFRLQHDGRWESMAPPAGIVHAAELLPGATFDFIWPTPSPQQQAFPLEIFRPVMVRFFDQAGSSFGQISFFTHPPTASTHLEAHYDDGLMTIRPPGEEDISASWVLWPQEEGIAPLTGPLAFEHRQPPAQRIEWHDGMAPLRLDLGAGLPGAMLLHETSAGITLQTLAGGLQSIEHRTAWLDATDIFYKVGSGAVAVLSALLLWQLAGAWRNRKAP